QAQRIDELEGRARRALMRCVEERRARLGRLAARVEGRNPQHRIAAAAQRCRFATERLERAMHRRIERLTHRVAVTDRTLRSLSPLATLDRGYAIVSRADDAHIVTDSSKISPGTGIRVRLASGRLAATVDKSSPPGDD